MKTVRLGLLLIVITNFAIAGDKGGNGSNQAQCSSGDYYVIKKIEEILQSQDEIISKYMENKLGISSKDIAKIDYSGEDRFMTLGDKVLNFMLMKIIGDECDSALTKRGEAGTFNVEYRNLDGLQCDIQIHSKIILGFLSEDKYKIILAHSLSDVSCR